MSWTLLMIFLVLIAPVKAGALATVSKRGVRGAFGFMVWGVSVQGRFLLEAGKREIRIGSRPMKLPRKKSGRFSFSRLIRSGAWKLLRRGVTIQRADAQMQLGLRDAAAAALLAGLAQALSGLLPGVRFRALPRLGGPWELRAKCIAETRLGILLAAFALTALFRGQKEEKTWIIPSAA